MPAGRARHWMSRRPHRPAEESFLTLSPDRAGRTAARGLFRLGLLLVVLLDLLVHAIRELKVPIDVAAVGIVAIGADRELLLPLPLQDLLALRGVVAPLLHLVHERPGLFLAKVRVP